MTEHPIIMQGWGVRGIIDGRKTQTRRVITRILGKGRVTEFGPSTTRGYDWHFRDRHMRWHDVHTPWLMERCPYGKPGDLLWVRETWKVQPTPGCSFGDSMMGRKLSVFYKDETRRDFVGEAINGPGIHVDIAALDYDPMKYGIWRPSIHMPKWAARLWLRLTDVRVERVQDITEADAVAEGVTPCGEHATLCPDHCYRNEFAVLWNSINAKRGYSWVSDPWVWVLTFEKAPPSAGRETT